MLSSAVFVVDLLIAALFFAAFYSKASMFRDLELSIHSYRIIRLEWIRPAAIVLLISEFMLFIAFASGLALYYKEMAAIVLLLMFNLLLLRKRRLDRENSSTCSCFGSISFLNRYPLSRNTIFIALCAGKCIVPTYALSTYMVFMQLIVSIIAICGSMILIDYYQTRNRHTTLKVNA
ncbi:MauE/DoxX family redox-associated membrane protein [Paenibacillus sp. L3-i20]|uniref:MauE/DoxX family redox-associated membrane protein n=1 Tax=Paenibacillus sp. L3-i20 TaxID=2905833 RepID=UPI001EE103F4|nr:MauE/DoxX family redox-associated membrane protein [Paenibacillus sp. L3-i20]